MSSRRPEALLGRVIADRYELDAVLGRGRFALAYQAIDLEADRLVALKLFPRMFAGDESFLRRFRHICEIASRIEHPNVVRLYGFGEGEDLYTVHELRVGGSLRGLIAAGRKLAAEQAAQLAVDALRGLDHLHQRGLTHGGLRPGNLLFNAEGQIAIADAGLAAVLGYVAVEQSTDPRFLPPELASGGRIGAAADLYSLSLCIGESVTGEVPLLGVDRDSTLLLRASAPLPFDAAVWGPAGEALAQMGLPDPDHRPSASEVEVALMARAPERGAVAKIVVPGPLPELGAEPLAVELPSVMPILPLRPNPEPEPESEVLDEGPKPVLKGRPGAAGSARPDAPLAANTEAETLAAHRDEDEPIVRRSRTEAERTSRIGRAMADATAEIAANPTGPLSRKLMAAVGAALLLVGGVYFVIQRRAARVPDVVGDNVAEVRTLAEDRGWDLELVNVRFDGTEPDEVIDQEPAEGTSLGGGKKFTVTVSLGASLVPVPPLVGLTQPAATEQLVAAGFVLGEVSNANDETAPAMTVMRADAAFDEQGQLPKGDTIDLVISNGPAPRTIPAGLAGKSPEEVAAIFTGLALRPAVTGEEFSEYPIGSVARVEPLEGTAIPRDSEVRIFVSSGRPPSPVPNVTGKGTGEADQILRSAGLNPIGIEGPGNAAVIRTEPAAGVQVETGTDVMIFTQ